MARVLIVEDDPASMDLALRIVRLEKHEPITTSDGETALAVARAVRPDLILLDLHIPKLDGWGFVKQFREGDEWARKVPIVAVSASATPPEMARALKVGCDDFLPKPYYPEQMRDILEKYLNRPKSTSGAAR